MQDMSREFECSGNNGLNWSHSDLVSLICAGETWQFRFKPQRPAVVSTLSDDELHHLGCMDKIREHGYPVVHRNIASAAAAAERDRIAKLPAVTSLSETDMKEIWLEITDTQSNDAGRLAVANAAIAQFQRDLMEGKI